MCVCCCASIVFRLYFVRIKDDRLGREKGNKDYGDIGNICGVVHCRRNELANAINYILPVERYTYS